MSTGDLISCVGRAHLRYMTLISFSGSAPVLFHPSIPSHYCFRYPLRSSRYDAPTAELIGLIGRPNDCLSVAPSDLKIRRLFMSGLGVPYEEGPPVPSPGS